MSSWPPDKTILVVSVIDDSLPSAAAPCAYVERPPSGLEAEAARIGELAVELRRLGSRQRRAGRKGRTDSSCGAQSDESAPRRALSLQGGTGNVLVLDDYSRAIGQNQMSESQGALGLVLMLFTHGLPYYLGVGLFVGCGGTAVGGWLRRLRERRHTASAAYVWYAESMPTNKAATDREPVAKMLRLILTGEEWRSLRVMAAEGDTSMQALVAAMVQREVVERVRARASEKVLATDRKRKGRA